MGLLSKIMKSLGDQPPRQADAELRHEIKAVAKDGRLHVRYQLPATLDAQIRLPGGVFGSVKNVSYGGLGVELGETASQAELPKETTVDFLALGLTVSVKVQLVRIVAGQEKKLFLGMAFCHDSPDVLQFLRLLIDGLRFGSSLTLVPSEIRQEAYKGAEWHCFRGDGPCDLMIRTAADKIAGALLTFPWKGVYGELSYTNGRLSTREAVLDSTLADHRPSPQMQTSAHLNPETLRRATWILASAPQSTQACIRPLLDVILPHLS